MLQITMMSGQTNTIQVLASWQYEAPAKIALVLRQLLSPDSRLLDVGCGTGLSGKALLEAGFSYIDGIDASTQSLKAAHATNAYNVLLEADLQKLPLQIANNYYDGLACVGVLTYLTDSAQILREFNRVVRSGGIVAMTQRSDLFNERKFREILSSLADEGLIQHLRNIRTATLPAR